MLISTITMRFCQFFKTIIISWRLDCERWNTWVKSEYTRVSFHIYSLCTFVWNCVDSISCKLNLVQYFMRPLIVDTLTSALLHYAFKFSSDVTTWGFQRKNGVSVLSVPCIFLHPCPKIKIELNRVLHWINQWSGQFYTCVTLLFKHHILSKLK